MISIRITGKLGYCVSFVHTKFYRNHKHQKISWFLRFQIFENLKINFSRYQDLQTRFYNQIHKMAGFKCHLTFSNILIENISTFFPHIRFQILKISRYQDIKNCTHMISIRITGKLGYCVSFVHTKFYRNHKHQNFDTLIFEISDFRKSENQFFKISRSTDKILQSNP